MTKRKSVCQQSANFHLSLHIANYCYICIIATVATLKLYSVRIELRIHRRKAIMESSGQFFNESFTSNHTQASEEFEVPLFVTYIGMVTSLTIATVVITAGKWLHDFHLISLLFIAVINPYSLF